MENKDFLVCPQCSHTNSASSSNCQTCNWLLIDDEIDQTEFISNNKEHLSRINKKLSKNNSKKLEHLKLIKHLDHFDIHTILGIGGMGTVYHARDKTLQRDVAIKVLKNSVLESKYTDMLLDEARLASKLNHNNIVTIYDVSRSENNNYIVMEWVDGKPLSELIPKNGFPFIKALNYALQIAKGLSFAHEKNIIHRDIKPQNIMVNTQGNIKILDFGIANLINQKNIDSVPNETYLYAGTPQFMSPEQVQGLSLDHRSDIFSFGIVLYQMLSGQNPFEHKDFSTLKDSICNGQYTSIQQIIPELPIQISNLVEKMLKNKRDERWQSTKNLSKEILSIYKKHTVKKNWWQRRHWFAKATIILPFLLLISWSMKDILFPVSTQQLIERKLNEATKIAILPFDNISGDPEIQLFGDGLAVNLGSDLSVIAGELGNIWIVPFSEIRRIENVTTKSVSDKYGVNLILTGSIQHMGSKRLLVLSLLNAYSGQQLKTTEININSEEIFQAHTMILKQALVLLNWNISESIEAKFNEQRPHLDGAYREYVKGNGYLYRYDQENNLNLSLKAFNRAIEIDPSYQNAYIGLAEVMLLYFNKSKDSKYLVQMMTIIDDLEAINPSHNQIQYLRANVSLKRGNYESAIKLFQLSINQNPRFFQAQTGLAIAYTKLGDKINAENVFKQVIQKAPNDLKLISNIGMFYFNDGQYIKSLEQFKKLIEISPNNHFGYTLTAAAYFSMDDIDNAISFTKKSIDLNPTDNAYTNLGTMFFSVKNYEQAIESFKNAIDLKDNDYVNWGNLADAYNLTNNPKSYESYKKAIELAKTSLAVNPNDSLTKADLSFYLAQIGRQDEAINLIENFNAKNSGIENFIVAQTYEQLGIIEKSIKHIQYALEKNYSMTEIINTPFLFKTRQSNEFKKLIE